MKIKIPTKQSLQNEMLIQGVLIAIIILGLLTPSLLTLFSMILPIFLGGYQMLSAIIRIVDYGSKIRKLYLMTSLTVVGFLIFAVFSDMGSIIFFTLALSACLGIFYFVLTLMQYQGKFLDYEISNTKSLSLEEIEDPDMIIDQISDNHKKRSES